MDGHRATFRSRDYRFDERLLRRRARRESLPNLVLGLVFLGVGGWLLVDDKVLPGLLAALFALVMLLLGWFSLRDGRVEADKLRATRIWFENDTFSIKHGQALETGQLNLLRRVVLQTRGGGRVRSVLVEFVGLGWRRWQDIDDMDSFAREFERRLSPSRVTVARWLHR